MYVVTVEFVVEPSQVDEFRQAVAAQAANSLRLEADCLVFDVCVSGDRPEQVYLYEKYTDAAAFKAHLQTDHFKSFESLVAEWLRDKTVATWSELESNR